MMLIFFIFWCSTSREYRVKRYIAFMNFINLSILRLLDKLFTIRWHTLDRLTSSPKSTVSSLRIESSYNWIPYCRSPHILSRPDEVCIIREICLSLMPRSFLGALLCFAITWKVVSLRFINERLFLAINFCILGDCGC